MSDKHEGEPEVDLYEHFRDMHLEGIDTHLEELISVVSGVKKHYTGPIGRFRKNLKKHDSESLYTAFSDLLPMTMNTAVQQQVMEQPESPQDWTINRLRGVVEDIMLFTSRFENSGITVFYTEHPFLD